MKNIISISSLFMLLFVLLISGWGYAQEKKHEITEIWEPQPRKITPGKGTQPPSDAIVLFDGSGLEKWQHADGSRAKWDVKNNVVTVNPGSGSIFTKADFGDMQLHLEFRSPESDRDNGQQKGNSGVYIQNRYEVQVLDSYDNKTYANGQAASIYKQHIPLVNASRKPGEWQTYDIIYQAPRFNEAGGVLIPARITVLHNGVLVQNRVTIQGKTCFVGAPQYQKHDLKKPLSLQDHGDLVSYRNIWVREL